MNPHTCIYILYIHVHTRTQSIPVHTNIRTKVHTSFIRTLFALQAVQRKKKVIKLPPIPQPLDKGTDEPTYISTICDWCAKDEEEKAAAALVRLCVYVHVCACVFCTGSKRHVLASSDRYSQTVLLRKKCRQVALFRSQREASGGQRSTCLIVDRNPGLEPPMLETVVLYRVFPIRPEIPLH